MPDLIDPLPEAPSTSDPSTFAAKADALLAALPTMVEQLNARVAGAPNIGNATTLLDATWAAPGAIGAGTPNSGAFTTLSATGAITGTTAALTKATAGDALILNNGGSNPQPLYFYTGDNTSSIGDTAGQGGSLWTITSLGGHQWNVNGGAALTIDASGVIFAGKAGVDTGATEGIELYQNGAAVFCRSANPPLILNRTNTEGTVVSIKQANVEQGSISISGTTTSYNAFLGSHWSQLSGGEREEILPGTILESINEWCEWPGEDNDRLPRCRVSTEAASRRVYGVFLAWDEDEHRMVQGVAEVIRQRTLTKLVGDKYVRAVEDYVSVEPQFVEHLVWNEDGSPCMQLTTPARFEEIEGELVKTADAVYAQAIHREPVMVQRDGVNDLYCAAIGAYRIRIAAGQSPKTGDLIESSDVPGCGRVQIDDVYRASTVAKIDAELVIETYEDGSFTMPCTLHCG